MAKKIAQAQASSCTSTWHAREKKAQAQSSSCTSTYTDCLSPPIPPVVQDTEETTQKPSQKVIGFPERVVRWITECVTTTRFLISINGELHGFFAGGRGLRQGDPLSPYLFVLAKEVFSGLMGLMVSEQDFKYHWRCEKEKITYLCFADDLMAFCRAEVALSGLIPNPDKSNLFASGVSSYLKDQLLDVLGYKEGVLPVRYLGVPLISTKLRALNCKILVYWSSVFLLPRAVIKQLENLLREEGGLGLRSLEIWNKAAMLKHLWSLCPDSASSLWVSWARCYLLKGRNIWELKCPGDCSWSWRKILGLRDIGRDKMKFRIGNGRRASLWYDNWHSLGPLEKILEERIIRESKLSRLAKVAVIVEGDTWRWPSVRSPALSDLMRDMLATFRPDSNREDVLRWEVDA
ncbi:uncharacterized protein LOC111388792 [Olea europaea var. sylvestris]|uniref:uncharacterized protein LOC111388792 n=1 Tax=Olea europaea var. sylvestris TaxID=158386 RepID=UPI000C1CE7D5|nr:uncharacterized protein LOC111388792 [Olea europaea var. sylvestris]